MTLAATDLVLRVHGMDCAEEISTLRQELGPLVGGAARLEFDLLNGRLTVRASGTTLDSREIMGAIQRAGMTAEPWTPESSRVREESFWERHGRTILTAVSGASTAAGLLLHSTLAGSFLAALGSEGMGVASGIPWPSKVLYLVGVLSGSWVVLPKAWVAARHLRPDMNLLMTIAITGALVIGEWFEASTVAFLFSLSLALEAWSVDRARRAVGALLDLAPATAHRLLPDGKDEELPLSRIPTGSRIVIRPGERIPLDGRVVSGSSHVDQAPITGESVPVSKNVSDEVFAGTINGDGLLTVEVTRASGDTTLDRIIRMVGEAQSRRAESEKWVDRFARIYTPVVLALAVVVMIVPPLLLSRSWDEWVYRALVLLVIACPCALVISTPVSIVCALAAAARNGVLIKGGVHVETPGRLRAIALDKTGTLTLGEPRIVEISTLHGHTEEEVLDVAVALESGSTHPLAQAIVAHGVTKGISPRRAEEFQIIQGKGARGRVDGKEYWLGSHRYLEERGQEDPEVHQKLETMSSAGRSVVVLGNDAHVCGMLALADGVRPTARQDIMDLRAAGIELIVMLTGDNRATAEAIGREVGIDEIHAELLPADKVRLIDEMVRRHSRVAMVGDGVNDAPALARASLGIAMGAAGSDAAIETADVALMSDDLSRLPWLVRHSRRTLRIVRQNISLSLAVKALFVVLTFTGSASLWSAIAADMGATLVVIANALRLLHPLDSSSRAA